MLFNLLNNTCVGHDFAFETIDLLPSFHVEIAGTN